MIKILTIIGARPQIIKAAAVSRAIRTIFRDQIYEVIVHTGQHYDKNMSEIFFDELQIPHPQYNLNVGSATHGKQTGAMIDKIEDVLSKENPSFVIVYGDANSTLATAVAASKLHIPIAHIEAGLRSFNKKMPEEINRIMCDHSSTLLFSPTLTGFNNLVKEGFKANPEPPYNADNPKIYHCGDVMLDNTLFYLNDKQNNSGILDKYEISRGNYLLLTIHRDNNTDKSRRLRDIFKAMQKISFLNKIPVIVPIHPRTSKAIDTLLTQDFFPEFKQNHYLKIIPPVSYLDMIILEKNAKMIFTDSGGVQKEAYFFKKPCVILRPVTEWVELVESGSSVLADAQEQMIINAYNELISKELSFPELFGDGHAAEFICREIIKCVQNQ